MTNFGKIKLRSAAVAVVAMLAFAGTSALAAQVHGSLPSSHPHAKTHPSNSPETEGSGKPKPSKSPEPSQSSESSESPESAADRGTHGACVSKVAKDHSAVADNGHGKTNHGGAVRKAAHDCPK